MPRKFALILCLAAVLLFPVGASAQTDIYISGPKSGFPVAVPQFCDRGNGSPYTVKISEVIAKNLELSGIFNVLNSATFVETPGKCLDPDKVAFSDWSVIGAEGLVRGDVKTTGRGGRTIQARLFLYDVLQQRSVVGKRYEADIDDFARIAHRFSNEVVKFFTGETGIFGTKITYVARMGRFKEIFVMDLDGSNNRQLTRDKGLAMSPSWSPTGDRIVYTSYRTRTPELFIVSPEGGTPKQLTKRKGLELGAKFAPDGTTILASASVGGASNIVLLDLKGKIIRNVTNSGAINVSPSWSPDGGQIAFCSNRSGGPQIYVMSASGDSPRRLSFTGSNYCTSPSWSPRGDKIAFVCRAAGGNQIFMAPASGGQSLQLTFQGNNEDPKWSPDGRYLVFSSNLGLAGPRNIVILPLLTGVPRQITFAKSQLSQPAWSPRLE